MSRRENGDLRCPGCRIHGTLCVCALVPRLETRTRVALVLHYTEARKPTNTGALAARCLANHEILVRGAEGSPDVGPALDGGYEPLLLYPGEDAIPLAPRPASAPPVLLVVPDGNWRQASKMRARVPGLRGLPCVTLPPDEPTAYRLRAEPKAGGLATAEAVARAVGILEGPEAREAIEWVFRAMVERTLWTRGALAERDVAAGIPKGVRRDAPGRAVSLDVGDAAPATGA